MIGGGSGEVGGFAEGVGFACEESGCPHLTSTLSNRSCSCELVRRYFPLRHDKYVLNHCKQKANIVTPRLPFSSTIQTWCFLDG